MFKQRAFKFSLLILAIIFVFYSVGRSFLEYYYDPQITVLLKGLGGLWISLVLLALAAYFGVFTTLKDYRVKSFLIAFVSATLLGVIWQLVMNFYRLTDVAAVDYNFNTAKDIFINALGGALAHFYFVKRKSGDKVAMPVEYPRF